MSENEHRRQSDRKPAQNKPIDRRVARSRATLQQALVSLIGKKRYDAITVADICEAANVGRSTFYAHFTSKDDLRRSNLDHLRQQLMARQREALADQPHQSFAFGRVLFEHARDHLHHYRALVGSRGGAVALGTVRQIVADLVRAELAAAGVTEDSTGSADGIPRELVVQYTVGAIMSVLTWWLDRGAKLAPERVDMMFRRLATQGIIPRETV